MKALVYLPTLLLASFATVGLSQEKPKPPDPARIKEKVTVALGKTFDVKFAVAGDALSRPEVVKDAKEGDEVLAVDFMQQGDRVLLVTRNPYEKALKFRALARLKGRKDYFETSIIPVQAGIFGIEAWQEPIEELVLFDFKLLDPKTKP